MALTDTAVRLARPRERVYRLNEGRGLCVLIQPNGGGFGTGGRAGSSAILLASKWLRESIRPPNGSKSEMVLIVLLRG